MADVTQSASWFSRLRRPSARKQTDWGDCGTAYGLDLSLQAGAQREADAAARAQAAKSTPRRWWQRGLGGSGKLPR